MLDGIATAAGLTPEAAFDIAFACEYPDERTLTRLLLSPGGVVEAVEHSGEDAVRAAILAALAPYRAAGGGYRIANEWHYLVARA